MKIKVIQFLIGDNSEYLKIAKLSEKLNKKYCELHNYEYKFNYITDITNIDFDTACLYKFKILLNNLTDCDYLVFLDADAAVSNPNIKIEDMIDNSHELFLSSANFRYDHIKRLYNMHKSLTDILLNHKDLLYNNRYNEYYKQYNLYNDGESLSSYDLIPVNEGLTIIKNTNLMKEYLNDCNKIGEYFLNKMKTSLSPETNTIIFLLQQNKYKDFYCFLPSYAQQCNLGSFENAYNEDQAFILHNYGRGISFDFKYTHLQQLLNNKYWKNIKI